ncbi:hypothetical protein EV127DRAFT_403670 [Xylaria flabelliformis]|nr:hypothetical protein EV127DRAFT_403670 [Xylaria flabelliformis]
MIYNTPTRNWCREDGNTTGLNDKQAHARPWDWPKPGFKHKASEGWRRCLNGRKLAAYWCCAVPAEARGVRRYSTTYTNKDVTYVPASVHKCNSEFGVEASLPAVENESEEALLSTQDSWMNCVCKSDYTVGVRVYYAVKEEVLSNVCCEAADRKQIKGVLPLSEAGVHLRKPLGSDFVIPVGELWLSPTTNYLHHHERDRRDLGLLSGSDGHCVSANFIGYLSVFPST